jgi:hypothetical protein
MLAAVLWLGNISFTVIDNENHVEAVADEGNIVDDRLKKRFYTATVLSFSKRVILHHEALIWLHVLGVC